MQKLLKELNEYSEYIMDDYEANLLEDIWDGFYYWFYNKLVNIPKEVRVGDPLLIIWLLILFPLLACGIAMLISGGIKAYKLAIPAKEKE